MHALLFAILLIEGFITISVEILSIRQLLPFFGGSVVITAIIIGVFLLFLALGYWRGGRYRHAYFKKLQANFMASALWIGFGLSYVFIAYFLKLCVFNLGFSYFISLNLYLLFILAPIVYWLGQTVPLTTNLFNQEQSVSAISGSALFLSTLGSFLGALITSLVLFHYLGVAKTVVFNCTVLFALTIYIQAYAKSPWLSMLLFAVLLYFIKVINVDAESRLFIKTNNYANYQVTNPDLNTKVLQINLSNSSQLNAKKEGFPYISFIGDLLFKQLHLQNKAILVIGAGGFSLTAAGVFGNQFTYVDIDPSIKAIAETHFLAQEIQGKFVSADARFYLNTHKTLFDVIVSDAYSNLITIPPSLLTVEYFQQLRDHLNTPGLLIINIIGDPLFKDAYTRRVDNTVRKIFPFCTVTPIGWQAVANLIYVCVKGKIDDHYYTDNLNSSTFDLFKG